MINGTLTVTGGISTASAWHYTAVHHVLKSYLDLRRYIVSAQESVSASVQL